MSPHKNKATANTDGVLKLQSDPAAFRRALMIDTDAGPTRFADVIEDWQDADFVALDDGWKRAAVGTSQPAQYQRAWLERPRGHSKSQDIALMAAWALFSSRRQIAGYAGAGDLDQARILRDAVGRLLHVNPWLAEILEVRNYAVLNVHTGSSLEIISSDAPTSYGLLPDFVIADEVCHWKKRDLFDSLLSSSAKRSTCMLVCISNAGMTDDWAWNLREAVRTDPTWYFKRLDGPVASWITPDRLAEQERLLPGIAYRRLWLNEWTTGGGDALSQEVIDAAFDPTLAPLTSAVDGYEYVGGLDLGVSRDASAVCILGVRRSHDGHGRIRLAYHRVWRPSKSKKVNLQEIEDALFILHGAFSLKALNYDPWQAQHLASRLQAGGLGVIESRRPLVTRVPMNEVTQSGGNLQLMASRLIESFNDHRVELYPNEELHRDLRKMRVEERSYGFRIVAPHDEHGHGDLGTAFSLAMLAATDLAAKRIVHAGAISSPQESVMAERMRQYAEESHRLLAGGSDYEGREQLNALMNQMSRGQRGTGLFRL